MSVDKDSPPGAWAQELERMPWRHSPQIKIEEALALMRRSGLQLEANLLALELTALRAEVERLKGGGK